MTLFDIREEALALEEALAAVRHPGAGGITFFLGVVRDENEGRAVTLLEYEAYGSMAKKELAAIGAEIEKEIPGARVSALHRVGKLQVGDAAVICAASAPSTGSGHRCARCNSCSRRRSCTKIAGSRPMR